MIIAFDIGNSNVVIGVYDDESWTDVWRLPTITDRTATVFYTTQIANLLVEHDIEIREINGIAVSSVVPDLNNPFGVIIPNIFNQSPHFLGPQFYDKLVLKIDKPTEIGSDLVANSLAAHHKYGGNRIVVDFGTALTFTIINNEGHILGVNIVPGLETAIKALFMNTAQLPEVPLVMPESAVGKNTIHAIQSGILNGYVGLVRHQLALLNEELNEEYLAIATGGLSEILTPLKKDFDVVDRSLTLEGLRIMLEMYV